MESWDETTNCCSWDGVECDKESGHVIGLDLSCSWLYGTIHPNSSLFSLPHLQSLNLAFNFFNYFPISSAFSRFTGLTHLNLSDSGLSGKISSKISLLSKLTSLDLSWNYNLRLKNPGFQLLVQNLTKLRELHLDNVNISSVIPSSMLNLTSLSSLHLAHCGLQGKFHDDIFHLPNLKELRLAGNSNLTGHLPKLNSSSPLEYLSLGSTSFSGELPNSIGNLKSLNRLYVYNCKFSGSIPASLEKLKNLTSLSLSNNNFEGSTLDVFPNLRNLAYLSLGGNNFSDPLLLLLANLTQLVLLSVSSTQVAGPLPSQTSVITNSRAILTNSSPIH
ncbi:hypothetical protein F0562_030144 [Nyssa sinensis]|uniref:Leucine-rich repeat-containing N-terminal plant-type domain-containing protein n=1 Tax=Nyssa sinensis TaxID=561372 RepID=A0A5J5B203_9ASTE|nr:hypothetical protein F0562_030144 [Nyssa sinensis]